MFLRGIDLLQFLFIGCPYSSSVFKVGQWQGLVQEININICRTRASRFASASPAIRIISFNSRLWTCRYSWTESS